MVTLRVCLFGVMRVSLGSEAVEDHMQRAVKGLLAYLVLFPRVHAREVLLDLFWGEYSESRARKCLNTALWRMRKTIEAQGVPRGTYLLTTSTGKVGFNRQSKYRLDTEDFEKDTRKALAKAYDTLTADEADELENALNHYTGDLLEGFYDDWVLRERQRLYSLELRGLAHLLKYHRHHQNFEKALSCGQKILDLDPLREEIHREMMRLHAANRQRTLAIRQYKKCCRILDYELGVGPMEETRLLHDQIYSQSKQNQKTSNMIANFSTVHQTLCQVHRALQEFEKVSDQLRRMTRRLEQFIN